MPQKSTTRSKGRSFMVTEYDKHGREIDQNVMFHKNVLRTFKEVLTIDNCKKLDAGLSVWKFSGESGETPSIQIQALN